jgi:transposase
MRSRRPRSRTAPEAPPAGRASSRPAPAGRLDGDRHRDLGSLRTQTICRLHVLVRELIPGGAPLRLQADRATVLLRRPRPASPVEVERKRLAQDFLGDIRRLDRDLEDLKGRITSAVATSGTRLTEHPGVGPIVAAIVLGQVGDPAAVPEPRSLRVLQRPPSKPQADFGSVTDSTSAETAAEPCHAPHRGHQIAHDTGGRAYFDRTLAEGKSRKEALSLAASPRG